jgi:Uma2 family endonuclease
MECGMSTLCKLTGAEFDRMAENGSFDVLGPKKIELIHGELRFMNPAGPVHDDYIDYLTRWSMDKNSIDVATIRVQCGFVCDDHRPEPDVLWLKPRRYGRTRPTAADALLLIEISDSSLSNDLKEKALIYAKAGVAEYWIIDIPNQILHRLWDSDGERYQKSEDIVAPQTPAPNHRPSAKLNLAELFEVN